MDLHKKTQKIREHNYHNDSFTPPREKGEGKGGGYARISVKLII